MNGADLKREAFLDQASLVTKEINVDIIQRIYMQQNRIFASDTHQLTVSIIIEDKR